MTDPTTRLAADARSAPPASSAAATRRAVYNTLRGSSGNLVEWYDVYVYTVFATYFESQFFDSADKNSTVYVYAIFAVTFLMRPVGSWFFGRYADRRGRRAALTFSVSLMAACSRSSPTISHAVDAPTAIKKEAGRESRFERAAE